MGARLHEGSAWRPQSRSYGDPARKRGTPFSPDEPAVLEFLLSANFIFMGPGSPRYAIRQLQGSLAWDHVRARQRLGATLAFASPAAIAVGAWGLSVYEVCKVGEDMHSCPGLNLFNDFALELSFIPHWNNGDAGDDVDTSCCFVGLQRFEMWSDSLPAENTIVGLDEHTGLIVDFGMRLCEVSGGSSVTLIKEGKPTVHPAGSKFALSVFGALSLPVPLERAWAREYPRSTSLACRSSQCASSPRTVGVNACAGGSGGD